MPSYNISLDKIRWAEEFLTSYGVLPKSATPVLRTLCENLFDVDPYAKKADSAFTAIPVNIAPIIKDGTDTELPFILTLYVKLPDGPNSMSSYGVKDFAINQIRKAAMLTYLADYANNRAMSYDDFNWGDYIGAKENVPLYGVYIDERSVTDAGGTIKDNPVCVIVDHDELVGSDASLVECVLMGKAPGSTPVKIGPVAYDPKEGLVKAAHDENMTYWLVLPDNRRVPICNDRDKDYQPNDFAFY